MSNDDILYFGQRALEERRFAKSAPSAIIAEIHLSLAMRYEAFMDQTHDVGTIKDEKRR